jgi:hypothetical protein
VLAVDAAVNWYVITGAGSIAFIFALGMFRAPISRLIDRISGASKDGITFERPQEIGEIKPTPLSFIELMALPVSASVLDREKTIQSQLHEFSFKNEEEKITALSRNLAAARVELEFNDIAHRVFGSQVTLLINLSGTHNGITKNQAEAIFEQAKIEFPELHGGRNLDDWLMYLQANNLITLIENKIDIMQFGTDFLKHLVDSRMAYNRYG